MNNKEFDFFKVIQQLKHKFHGVIRVESIYKLSDDYQEIFLNNASDVYLKYEPLLLSSRTINKDAHNDIFLLEPHKYYKIVFEMYDAFNKKTLVDDIEFNLNKKLIGTGLIIQDNIDIKDKAIYMYNASENIIMIQKKFIIGDWHV